jgi:hypothetical protein
MGEYAQDEIERGMMEDYPFGWPRSRTRRAMAYPRPPQKPTMAPRPASVDDDHFTWWWDEQRFTTESPFEMAQRAWEEAVRRMRTANKG